MIFFKLLYGEIHITIFRSWAKTENHFLYNPFIIESENGLISIDLYIQYVDKLSEKKKTFNTYLTLIEMKRKDIILYKVQMKQYYITSIGLIYL